jgi:hypothetical protein
MGRRGNCSNASIFAPGLYFRYPKRKDMLFSSCSLWSLPDGRLSFYLSSIHFITLGNRGILPFARQGGVQGEINPCNSVFHARYQTLFSVLRGALRSRRQHAVPASRRVEAVGAGFLLPCFLNCLHLEGCRRLWGVAYMTCYILDGWLVASGMLRGTVL